MYFPLNIAVWSTFLLFHNSHAFSTRPSRPSFRLFSTAAVASFTPGEDVSVNDLEKTAPDECIEKVIQKITGTGGGQVIAPYKSRSDWSLRQWKGTVLPDALKKGTANVLVCIALTLLLRRACNADWAFGTAPTASNNVMIQRLSLLNKVWHYQMTLTTFTTSFFVTQAFSFWRDIFGMSRSLQGKITDIGMLLATNVKRDRESGNYTPESSLLLENIAAELRLFDIFFWASASRHFRVLLTDRGMRRMEECGLLTSKQSNAFQNMDNVPPGARYYAFLKWVMIRAKEARQDGTLEGSTAVDHVFLEKCCELKGLCSSISNKMSGRMPLAYAHLVQISNDSFLHLAPLALFSELGTLSAICAPILTIFFQGSYMLAKVFLDPFQNENFGSVASGAKINLGFLMRSANGASNVLKNAAASSPFLSNLGTKTMLLK